jgi:hypothetical protein
MHENYKLPFDKRSAIYRSFQWGKKLDCKRRIASALESIRQESQTPDV